MSSCQPVTPTKCLAYCHRVVSSPTGVTPRKKNSKSQRHQSNRWSSEETAFLLDYVEQRGRTNINWQHCAAQLSSTFTVSRTGISCKSHYYRLNLTRDTVQIDNIQLQLDMSSERRANFSWVSYGEKGRGRSRVVPTGLIVLHSLTHDDPGLGEGSVSTPDDTEVSVKTPLDDTEGSVNRDHPPAADELVPDRTVMSTGPSDDAEVADILCHIKIEVLPSVDDESSTTKKEIISCQTIRCSPTYLLSCVCLDHSYAAGETAVTETAKMPSSEQVTYTDKSLPVNVILEKSKVNAQAADGIPGNVPQRGRPYKSRKMSPQKGTRACTTCGKVSQVSPNDLVYKLGIEHAPGGLDRKTTTRHVVAASEQIHDSEMLVNQTDSPDSGYTLKTTNVAAPEPVEKESQHYMCDSCVAVFGGINNQISGSELERLVETILPQNDEKAANSLSSRLQMLRWRVHVCNRCGDYFPSTLALAQHKKIHLGTKPYVCEYCDKGFSSKGHLKEHSKVHTGYKPHQCDECGKCFARNNKLKAHKRTHTGEKPYMCFDCGKCFFDSSGKNRHMKNSCPLRNRSSFMIISEPGE